MITSCINGDKVIYFEIYETFDGLGIFQSQYENDFLETSPFFTT